MVFIMSQSLDVLSNGWAIDTTAPVDLNKPADNDVSGPLRSCLSLIMRPILTFAGSVTVQYIPYQLLLQLRVKWRHLATHWHS